MAVAGCTGGLASIEASGVLDDTHRLNEHVGVGCRSAQALRAAEDDV